MASRSRFETRLAIRIGDSALNLRLCIRLRVLLAVLAASGLLATSPALISALAQLAR